MAPPAHAHPVSAPAPFDVTEHRPLRRLVGAVSPMVNAATRLAGMAWTEGATVLGRLGYQWDALGERDALGAVLTRSTASPVWDEHEFFQAGRADVDRLMTDIARRAPWLATRRALDFGCGVGRISLALSDHFVEVHGVDVAGSMIARARQENGALGRCHFGVNRRPHLHRYQTGTFDLVYSRLVLQHIPPELVRRYIPELVRVLAPGGLLVFQLPTVIWDPRRSFYDAPVRGRVKRALPKRMVRAYRTLKYPFFRPRATDMEMFGLARDTVVGLVDRAGARMLAMTPDASHGTSEPGFEYWVTRPSAVSRRPNAPRIARVA
jgi:SAM-dependent methyltransferase